MTKKFKTPILFLIWIIFRGASDEELAELTANYKKATIDEQYLIPIGGIKPYLKILLNYPRDLITMEKGFQEKYWT